MSTVELLAYLARTTPYPEVRELLHALFRERARRRQSSWWRRFWTSMFLCGADSPENPHELHIHEPEGTTEVLCAALGGAIPKGVSRYAAVAAWLTRNGFFG